MVMQRKEELPAKRGIIYEKCAYVISAFIFGVQVAGIARH